VPSETSLHREFPVRAIGACFAITAFAVAITSGLFSRTEAAQTLTTAIVAMFVCQPIGLAIGYALKYATFEQVEMHHESNPVPDAYEPAQASDGEPSVGVDATDPKESANSRTEFS